MFDIKWIRDNPEAFDAGLKKRGMAAAAVVNDGRISQLAPVLGESLDHLLETGAD